VTARTVVVTGAGRGLGAVICNKLRAQGFQVIATDITGAPEILDVTDAQACRDLAQRVRPDVWINNAAVLVPGRSFDQPDDEVMQAVSVNLLGVMHGTRAAVDIMRERAAGQGQGHVINIGSLASWVPVPGEAIYAATKAGVLSFTLGLEGDLQAQGVRGIHFSVICPDGMLTPMITEELDNPAIALTFSGLRLVTPEEVANAIVKVLRKPRRVVSVPHWRGAQVRLLGMAPDVMLSAAGLFTRLGQSQQARVRRHQGRQHQGH
jgi:short-subunit dehydrogenase